MTKAWVAWPQYSFGIVLHGCNVGALQGAAASLLQAAPSGISSISTTACTRYAGHSCDVTHALTVSLIGKSLTALKRGLTDSH